MYRDVDRNPGSFRSGVIFDGAATLNNDTDVIVQTINGFDQASAFDQVSGSPNARMGYIVGDGQSFPERVWIGTDADNLVRRTDISFNGSSDPTWDDITRSLSSTEVPVNAGSVTTKIDHAQGSFDCLSFAAIWVNTDVIDTDNDGLLDIWETAVSDTTFGKPGGFRDPALPCLVNHTICAASATGNLLLDLNKLGAYRLHKDLFVEADFMEEKMTNLLNPNDPPNGPKSTIHSHDLRLKTDVVHLVGDAFKFAPVPNPDGNPGDISLRRDDSARRGRLCR